MGRFLLWLISLVFSCSGSRLSSVSLALLQLFCLFLAIYANLSALHVIEYHPTLDVAMRTGKVVVSIGFILVFSLGTISAVARLDQWWGMFAPQPSHSSRYYLISGVTVNNTETDLWDGGPALLQYRSPSFRVPTVAHFESARWRRVLAEMGNQRVRLCWARGSRCFPTLVVTFFLLLFTQSMMFYAHFLCKQWNAYGPGRLGDGHRLKTVKTIRRTVSAISSRFPLTLVAGSHSRMERHCEQAGDGRRRSCLDSSLSEMNEKKRHGHFGTLFF